MKKFENRCILIDKHFSISVHCPLDCGFKNKKQVLAATNIILSNAIKSGEWKEFCFGSSGCEAKYPIKTMNEMKVRKIRDYHYDNGADDYDVECEIEIDCNLKTDTTDIFG